MSTIVPRVSVGMPVYNGEKFLRTALDSVLTQTFSDFELIISDNASSDRTEEVCREYAEKDSRIRYVRQEKNLGAARNFNRVFTLSSGIYFKWFAHDDILAPTYLERCVAVLDACPRSVVLCFPQRVEMTSGGVVLGEDRRSRWNEAGPPFDRIGFFRLMRVPERRYPTLVFGLARAETLRKTRLIGSYNCTDLVLVAELKLLGEFRQIPEPLFLNRLHDETTEFRLARRTVDGEADWYDPHARPNSHWPELKLLRERVAGVMRSDCSVFAKPWYLACVLIGLLVERIPQWLRRRRVRLRRRIERVWERQSVALVSRGARLLCAERAWAMLSGIRHADRKRIRLALSVPSNSTTVQLLEFVAGCLRGRRDAPAARLLAEWRDGSCELRRRAAAEVLDRRAGDNPDEPDCSPEASRTRMRTPPRDRLGVTGSSNE